MAGETYYFLFSVMFVLLGIFCITSLLLLRKGRTMFGISVKRGTPEYKRSVELASGRNIAIAAILTTIFIGNLVYVISSLMRLDEYGGASLLFLAGFVILIFVATFPFIHKQTRDMYELGRTKKQK